MAARDTGDTSGAAGQLPSPGAHVRVSLPGHHAGLRSSVHEIAGDELVIAAPVEPPGVAPLPLGGELSLSWTSDRGLHRLGVQLRQRLTRPPRWRVGVLAPPQREQRRAGYRVPVMSSVDVRLDGTWRRARLVDLSEGGLRCLLASGTDVAERSPCRVRLDLVRRGLELSALVVRVREGIDAMVDIGVQFVEVPAALSDELRRYLFDAQLELGRLDGFSEG